MTWCLELYPSIHSVREGFHVLRTFHYEVCSYYTCLGSSASITNGLVSFLNHIPSDISFSQIFFPVSNHSFSSVSLWACFTDLPTQWQRSSKDQPQRLSSVHVPFPLTMGLYVISMIVAPKLNSRPDLSLQLQLVHLHTHFTGKYLIGIGNSDLFHVLTRSINFSLLTC